jgi:hypothetical protein
MYADDYTRGTMNDMLQAQKEMIEFEVEYYRMKSVRLGYIVLTLCIIVLTLCIIGVILYGSYKYGVL